ncbi:hypothetical protein CRM82_19185 [Comamonas terrigena]|uniref:Uncharacterized protein n=2 Tax=Comamonadaceae TaxID=80864 RepID=A0A2A7UYW0_COMTR|nr:hypothetical protein [Comamonas terrigena]PEH90437.1 hypothetical protein CRM82_19185 [Comamonas terrigena]
MPTFDVEEAKERVAKLKLPEANTPLRMHAVVKLAPIPLPRAVRYESQVIYTLALAGTALLVWGGFQVPVDWLLWYGMAALLVFAGLFRIEGPLTRAEHKARSMEVRLRHEDYLQAESRLKQVLSERFNERMTEFQTMQNLYEQAKKAVTAIEQNKGNSFLSALSNPFRTEKTEAELLADEVERLEQRMAALVSELEDFSDIHKEEIDAAIMARHNARLAYWQAKLDEAVMTGEAVQQH